MSPDLAPLRLDELVPSVEFDAVLMPPLTQLQPLAANIPPADAAPQNVLVHAAPTHIVPSNAQHFPTPTAPQRSFVSHAPHIPPLVYDPRLYVQIPSQSPPIHNRLAAVSSLHPSHTQTSVSSGSLVVPGIITHGAGLYRQVSHHHQTPLTHMPDVLSPAVPVAPRAPSYTNVIAHVPSCATTKPAQLSTSSAPESVPSLPTTPVPSPASVKKPKTKPKRKPTITKRARPKKSVRSASPLLPPVSAAFRTLPPQPGAASQGLSPHVTYATPSDMPAGQPIAQAGLQLPAVVTSQKLQAPVTSATGSVTPIQGIRKPSQQVSTLGASRCVCSVAGNVSGSQRPKHAPQKPSARAKPHAQTPVTASAQATGHRMSSLNFANARLPSVQAPQAQKLPMNATAPEPSLAGNIRGSGQAGGMKQRGAGRLSAEQWIREIATAGHQTPTTAGEATDGSPQTSARNMGRPSEPPSVMHHPSAAAKGATVALKTTNPKAALRTGSKIAKRNGGKTGGAGGRASTQSRRVAQRSHARGPTGDAGDALRNGVTTGQHLLESTAAASHVLAGHAAARGEESRMTSIQKAPTVQNACSADGKICTEDTGDAKRRVAAASLLAKARAPASAQALNQHLEENAARRASSTEAHGGQPRARTDGDDPFGSTKEVRGMTFDTQGESRWRKADRLGVDLRGIGISSSKAPKVQKRGRSVPEPPQDAEIRPGSNFENIFDASHSMSTAHGTQLLNQDTLRSDEIPGLDCEQSTSPQMTDLFAASPQLTQLPSDTPANIRDSQHMFSPRATPHAQSQPVQASRPLPFQHPHNRSDEQEIDAFFRFTIPESISLLEHFSSSAAVSHRPPAHPASTPLTTPPVYQHCPSARSAEQLNLPEGPDRNTPAPSQSPLQQEVPPQSFAQQHLRPTPHQRSQSPFQPVAPQRPPSALSNQTTQLSLTRHTRQVHDLVNKVPQEQQPHERESMPRNAIMPALPAAPIVPLAAGPLAKAGTSSTARLPAKKHAVTKTQSQPKGVKKRPRALRKPPAKKQVAGPRPYKPTAIAPSPRSASPRMPSNFSASKTIPPTKAKHTADDPAPPAPSPPPITLPTTEARQLRLHLSPPRQPADATAPQRPAEESQNQRTAKRPCNAAKSAETKSRKESVTPKVTPSAKELTTTARFVPAATPTEQAGRKSSSDPTAIPITQLGAQVTSKLSAQSSERPPANQPHSAPNLRLRLSLNSGSQKSPSTVDEARKDAKANANIAGTAHKGTETPQNPDVLSPLTESTVQGLPSESPGDATSDSDRMADACNVGQKITKLAENSRAELGTRATVLPPVSMTARRGPSVLVKLRLKPTLSEAALLSKHGTCLPETVLESGSGSWFENSRRLSGCPRKKGSRSARESNAKRRRVTSPILSLRLVKPPATGVAEIPGRARKGNDKRGGISGSPDENSTETVTRNSTRETDSPVRKASAGSPAGKLVKPRKATDKSLAKKRMRRGLVRDNSGESAAGLRSNGVLGKRCVALLQRRRIAGAETATAARRSSGELPSNRVSGATRRNGKNGASGRGDLVTFSKTEKVVPSFDAEVKNLLSSKAVRPDEATFSPVSSGNLYSQHANVLEVNCVLCQNKVAYSETVKHPCLSIRAFNVCRPCHKAVSTRLQAHGAKRKDALLSNKKSIVQRTTLFVTLLEDIVQNFTPSEREQRDLQSMHDFIANRPWAELVKRAETLAVPHDMIAVLRVTLRRVGFTIRAGKLRWPSGVFALPSADDTRALVAKAIPPRLEDLRRQLLPGEAAWTATFGDNHRLATEPSACAVYEKLFGLIGLRLSHVNECKAHDGPGSPCKVMLEAVSTGAAMYRAASMLTGTVTRELLSEAWSEDEALRFIDEHDAEQANESFIGDLSDVCCLCGSCSNRDSETQSLRLTQCSDCTRSFCSVCLPNVLGTSEYIRSFGLEGYCCLMCRLHRKAETGQGLKSKRVGQDRRVRLQLPGTKKKGDRIVKAALPMLLLAPKVRADLFLRGQHPESNKLAGFAKFCEIVNEHNLRSSLSSSSTLPDHHVCLKCKYSLPSGDACEEEVVRCGHENCINVMHKNCVPQERQARRRGGRSKWHCPHHQCSSCEQRDETKLTRCRTCPATFCKDHMPRPSEVLVFSERSIACSCCKSYLRAPQLTGPRIAQRPSEAQRKKSLLSVALAINQRQRIAAVENIASAPKVRSQGWSSFQSFRSEVDAKPQR